jgi:hypothetical protein
MILRITIPDEVYETHGTVNPKNPRKVMEAILEKFQGVDPTKKSILLTDNVLSDVQSLLGTSVDTPENLLAALKQALLFRVDGVEITLTDAQRKKLVTQATAWKRDPQEFVAQQVRENLRSI